MKKYKIKDTSENNEISLKRFHSIILRISTNNMQQYGVPEFKDLQTSTRTIMVYTNVQFVLLNIFKGLYITSIDVPLTKKKKNVDKKRLQAPYGSIISVQKGTQIRGIDIRKTKKHWCSVNCQLTEERGNKTVRINTIIEKLYPVEGTDIFEIRYWCTKCERFYSLRELEKITHFLNQVTIVLSLERTILNIMLFKDSFKIAGCKEDRDAIEAAMILWQDYIDGIDKSWRYRASLPQEAKLKPEFIFKLVMRNVDFKLGFYIDREALNNLMNDERYADVVYMSQCETTGHTNVNIKMYSSKPKNYLYDCLVMPKNVDAYFTRMFHNPYKPKKEKKAKYITFIVFSSSEIILSGRYEENMKRMYEFFVKEVVTHKDLIEEQINEPQIDLLTHLKERGLIGKK